jgi:hypothetical protein
MSTVAAAIGGRLVPVEHTRLGTVPKIARGVTIGKAKIYDLEIALVETSEDRWSLRATVSMHALTISDARVSTAMASEIADLRDGLNHFELLVAQHSSGVGGLWSTTEIRETIDARLRENAEFAAQLASLLEEAMGRGHGQVLPSGAVGEA